MYLNSLDWAVLAAYTITALSPGVFFNLAIVAAILLAGINITGVPLGAEPHTTVLVAAIVTAAYSATQNRPASPG